MNYSFNTKEEYLQFVADLMIDLRGDWSHSYASRIYVLKETLENMLTDHKDMEPQIKEALEVCKGQLELDDEFPDGRYFRDCTDLYNYDYAEGRTKAVADALYDTCNNPEDRWYDPDGSDYKDLDA